jgi:hypothetical protein
MPATVSNPCGGTPGPQPYDNLTWRDPQMWQDRRNNKKRGDQLRSTGDLGGVPGSIACVRARPTRASETPAAE